MKKITLLGVLAGLCLYVAGQAEHFIPVQKPDSCYLTVGDAIPDITFYSTACHRDSVKRSSLRPELVILDIWSITCIPCIREFPKLDSLQKMFNGKLEIMLVSINGNEKIARDAEAAIRRFEDVMKKKLGLPSFYISPHTTSLFFFLVNTPHYIWMNRAGRIIAITGPGEITAYNIAALLRWKHVTMELKPSFTQPGTIAETQKVTVHLKHPL